MKKLLLFLIVPVFIAGNLKAQLSFEANQILYLNFNDDTDLEYNDQDIELTDDGGVVGEDGKFDGGVYFDGVESFMVFEPFDDWNHGMDFTLSWWMKTTSTEDFWGIMGFGTYSGDCNTDYYDDEERVGGMFLSSFDGILNWEISWVSGLWPEEGNEPSPWNDGEWHHFALVYDVEATTMRMYIDNVNYYVEEEPISIAADLVDINNDEGFDATIEDDNFRLGCVGRGWFPGDPEEEFPEIMWFDGSMDDVRLFDIPLSAEEVGELYEYVPSGIDEVKSIKQINIYPNPASDVLQVRTKAHSFAVNVINMTGQVVLSSVNERSIDISQLSEGMYFVDVNVDGERAVQKLVIE